MKQDIKKRLVRFFAGDEMLITIAYLLGVNMAIFTDDHGSLWILIYLFVTRIIDKRRKNE